MDDKKRKKILWIAIALFVVMAVLFLIIRLSDQEPEVTNQNPEAVENQPVFEPKSVDLDLESVEVEAELGTESNVEFTVVNLAKSYASRFGSWSTDNKGKNLEELLSLSTKSMKDFLSSRDLGPDEGIYTGVTTRSLSAKIESLDDSTAEVLVGTQRVETDDSLNDTIYYQNILISLQRFGDTWLVSKAVWE